ncbi:alkaline phosphatase PhoX [Couchioplanes caeruleus]|uniref:Translocation protein TolB n=2 Tax=Couchioplanes caeruleus TaxID=56438 RepID=A0A1K0FJC2_9ACTN|nr:alkaline phosphatase PhoX [Couchioplanes caeruleus]OJF12941.1 translocation protein TolB [Couchioplanes caeruleus subsp. caeruleus]ROP28877.1 WD40 repeat protein [Couchioplanes caeruleus]
MDRRTMLRATVVGTAAVALPFTAWSAAYGAPAQNAVGPYGPLLPPDANGIQLPAGFTSTVVARSRQTVPGTSYVWHDAPDGGAVFANGTGWIYVSNSEVTAFAGGGASRILFSSSGAVVGASRILSGTNVNCAGGKTPWNTWLSCEEVSRGRVYETYPLGGAAVARLAMGRFKHEAAAADPVRKVIYLTEDESDGKFYRFVPTTWGDLSAGTLEVMRAGTATSGTFTWARVPDPDGSPLATRRQVSGAKTFNGGEGCHYADDTVWFTTKGDNRIWQVNLTAGTYELAYDDDLVNPGPAPLTGVDNITGTAGGDLYVAEDGGTMDICLITPDDKVSVFLRVTGHNGSEITGPAFTPAGDRLYFSSQRGTSGLSSGGITYCVTGPFRR